MVNITLMCTMGVFLYHDITVNMKIEYDCLDLTVWENFIHNFFIIVHLFFMEIYQNSFISIFGNSVSFIINDGYYTIIDTDNVKNTMNDLLILSYLKMGEL